MADDPRVEEPATPEPAGDGFAWLRAQLASPPAGSGEAAGDFVAANEALGEALTQVGMALGLPKPRPGSTWGVDEVLRCARVAGSGVAEHEYGPDEIALMDAHEAERPNWDVEHPHYLGGSAATAGPGEAVDREELVRAFMVAERVHSDRWRYLPERADRAEAEAMADVALAEIERQRGERL